MAERKSTAVLIKLSPAEKRTLYAAARREHLPMATWLRALGLHAARAANDKGHTMKMILVASMLAFAVACGGSTGETGTVGPVGPTGPQGPQGPAATAQVRLRVFTTSAPADTAFAACPANSHAIGGACSCAATSGVTDARLVTAQLLTLGAGGYVCGCAGTVTAPETMTATAQVTCIDGASVAVE